MVCTLYSLGTYQIPHPEIWDKLGQILKHYGLFQITLIVGARAGIKDVFL